MQMRTNHQGFNLIELMVAMTISLLALSAIGQIFVSVKQSFNSLDALSEVQENARYVFEKMARDIRMAGYTGGATKKPDATDGPVANLLLDQQASCTETLDHPEYYDLYDQPLHGTDQTLLILYADTQRMYTLASFAVTEEDGDQYLLLNCPDVNFPRPGDILVASDRTYSALFQILHTDPVNPDNTNCPSTATIKVYYRYSADPGYCYNTASAIEPGNSSYTLDGFNAFLPGVLLYPLNVTGYYIRTNVAGVSSLYREQPGDDEELIQGIQSLQFLYGLDTDNDLAVNSYVSAATVNTNWQHVLSVRVTLTLFSEPINQINEQGQTVSLPIERSFTSTIAIRNRLL
jgi:type IV pilus assembly protein PilW